MNLWKRKYKCQVKYVKALQLFYKTQPMHNALKVAFLLILMSGAVLSIANTYPNVYLVSLVFNFSNWNYISMLKKNVSPLQDMLFSRMKARLARINEIESLAKENPTFPEVKRLTYSEKSPYLFVTKQIRNMNLLHLHRSKINKVGTLMSPI